MWVWTAVIAVFNVSECSHAFSALRNRGVAFLRISAPSSKGTTLSGGGSNDVLTAPRRLLVAVTTCNQWHLTAALLHNLNTLVDPIDVLVVDDASEDGTAARAKEFGVGVLAVRFAFAHCFAIFFGGGSGMPVVSVCPCLSCDFVASPLHCCFHGFSLTRTSAVPCSSAQRTTRCDSRLERRVQVLH